MESMRYHLICELNKRWNIPFGEKMFEFKNLKYRALLALDECQTLQEVKKYDERLSWDMIDYLQQAVVNQHSIVKKLVQLIDYETNAYRVMIFLVEN